MTSFSFKISKFYAKYLPAVKKMLDIRSSWSGVRMRNTKGRVSLTCLGLAEC